MNNIFKWFMSLPLVMKVHAYLSRVWTDAQMAHFAWGAWLVLAFSVHHNFRTGIESVIGFAIFKEILLDRLDPQETWKKSLTDTLWWAFGIIAASIVTLV